MLKKKGKEVEVELENDSYLLEMRELKNKNKRMKEVR